MARNAAFNLQSTPFRENVHCRIEHAGRFALDTSFKCSEYLKEARARYARVREEFQAIAHALFPVLVSEIVREVTHYECLRVSEVLCDSRHSSRTAVPWCQIVSPDLLVVLERH